MSLDFYLELSPTTEPCKCTCCGNEHTHTFSDEIYWANITHNLTKMASEAGIYEVLWHPVENGMTKARHLIPVLNTGLSSLKAKPDYFQQFNASNGWGTYNHFVQFVDKILQACIENPDANVRTSV